MKRIQIILILMLTYCLAQGQTVTIGTKEVPGTTSKFQKVLKSQKRYAVDASLVAKHDFTGGDGSLNVKMRLYGKDFEMDLFRNDMVDGRTSFSTNGAKARILESPNIQLYKGHLKGDKSKYVRLSIIDGKYMDGYICLGDEFLYISSLLEERCADIVAYYGRDIIEDSNAFCGTGEVETVRKSLMKASRSADFSNTVRLLRIATEADYELYRLYGSNTNAHVLSILNQVEGVYQETFNILFQVVYQNYYSSSSQPYTASISGGNPNNLLVQLRDDWIFNHSTVNRDMVFLFTGKEVESLAGAVTAEGALCKFFSNCYGFVANGIFTIPTTAHEIGHLFGGSHDDCQNGGTSNASIMCQGTKKYPLYFSAASQARIKNHISTYDCLTSISVTGPSVICPQGIFTVTNLPNNATVQWSCSDSRTSIVSGQGTANVTL